MLPGLQLQTTNLLALPNPRTRGDTITYRFAAKMVKEVGGAEEEDDDISGACAGEGDEDGKHVTKGTKVDLSDMGTKVEAHQRGRCGSVRTGGADGLVIREEVDDVDDADFA